MSDSNFSTATAFIESTNSREIDSSIITLHYSVQNNATNGAPVVTILIGISVAILIVLTAIVVVTLVLLYLRKSSQSKRSLIMAIHIQHYAEERLNNYSHTHSNLLLTCMIRFN